MAITTIITGPTRPAKSSYSFLHLLCVGYQGLEMSTALQQGDQVRTESGDIGTVVHTSRLTAFVALAMPEQENQVQAFLESQLTKIEQRELTPA
jgi:hypothetical protein